MKINNPQKSLAHMRVLKIINQTEEMSKHIKNMSEMMKKCHQCPLRAAFGHLTKRGGGLRPPPPFGNHVKDKDDLSFINFDIFLIFFNLFSVSLIIFRALMCARLFGGYLFSLFSPIICKSSISSLFNDFIIFGGI